MKLKLTKWMNGCTGRIEKDIVIKKDEIERFMVEHFERAKNTQCEMWLHGNCRGQHKIYAQIFRHKLFININNKMIKIGDAKWN